MLPQHHVRPVLLRPASGDDHRRLPRTDGVAHLGPGQVLDEDLRVLGGGAGGERRAGEEGEEREPDRSLPAPGGATGGERAAAAGAVAPRPARGAEAGTVNGAWKARGESESGTRKGTVAAAADTPSPRGPPPPAVLVVAAASPGVYCPQSPAGSRGARPAYPLEPGVAAMRKMLVGVLAATAVLGASEAERAGRRGPAPQPPMGFFVTSAAPATEPTSAAWRGPTPTALASAAAAGTAGRVWRAYLSTTGPWRERPRPHRRGALVQRPAAPSSPRTGRPPRRRPPGPQQHQQGLRPGREGPARQRARRPAQPARHAHGLRLARGALLGDRRRHHVQQLDEQLGRQRDGGTPRPLGRRQLLLERRPRQPRLQPAGPVGTGGNGLFYCFAAS